MKRRHKITDAVDNIVHQDADMSSHDRTIIEAHRALRTHIRAAYADILPQNELPALAGRVLAHARQSHPRTQEKISHFFSELFYPRRTRWCASCAAAACVACIVFLFAFPLLPSHSHAQSHESFVMHCTPNGHIIYQYIEYEDASQ